LQTATESLEEFASFFSTLQMETICSNNLDFMIALSPRPQQITIKKKPNKQTKTTTTTTKNGQFYQDLQRPSGDKQKSLVWLHGSGLKRKMKSLIIAARDQVLNTRYLQRNIMQQPIDSKYRMRLL